MTNIIADLLDYLEVKHTKHFVGKLFDEHPHNDDMYGLKDMLESFNIESVGVDIKDKDMGNMNFPAICHVKKKFTIVSGSENGSVNLWVNGKSNPVDLPAFKSQWDGKALIITSTENAKENDYYHNLGLEWITRLSWYSLFCIPLILLFVLSLNNTAIRDLSNIPIIILDIAGSFLCYLLIKKKVTTDSAFGDRFCSMITENGCESVLSSKSASILYIYSWSEIGLAYFFANILILSFVPQYQPGLILVNYIAMVYGIWSVWYQAKAKQWCTLCLSVQFTIWLLGIYYTILFGKTVVTSNIVLDFIIVSMFLALIIVITHFVVKSYIDNYILTSLVRKTRRFQVDNEIFRVKCMNGTKHTDSADASSVFYGDSSAEYQTTVLLNPHCPHCRDFHKKTEHLLQKDDLKFGVRFIFVSFGSQYDYACKIFIGAYQQMGKHKAMELLSKWFDNMQNSNEDFAGKHGIDIDNETVNREFNLHRQWSLDNNLLKTPHVLVNGYDLPDVYEIEDLERMDQM